MQTKQKLTYYAFWLTGLEFPLPVFYTCLKNPTPVLNGHSSFSTKQNEATFFLREHGHRPSAELGVTSFREHLLSTFCMPEMVVNKPRSRPQGPPGELPLR